MSLFHDIKQTRHLAKNQSVAGIYASQFGNNIMRFAFPFRKKFYCWLCKIDVSIIRARKNAKVPCADSMLFFALCKFSRYDKFVKINHMLLPR